MTITLRAGVLNSGIQQNGTEFLTVDTSNNATLSNNLTVTGAVSGTTGTFTGVAVTGTGALRGSYGTGGITTNFAAGDTALNANTTGAFNSAVGFQSLSSNTTGSNNSAFGLNALYYNVSGSGNAAQGSYALFYNTASNNTAVGYQAMYGASGTSTGTGNSALGYQALGSNTSGAYNSALGYQALYSNTTGNYNSAFGQVALSSVTTTDSSSAFGQAALRYNTGANNTAVGCQAMQGASGTSTGSHNSAMGVNALNSNTTGFCNTVLGYAAALSTTGNYNTLIGLYRGALTPVMATGSNWTVLSDGQENVKLAIDTNSAIWAVNGQPFFNQAAPTAKTAAATLTGAELLTGIITYNGVAASLTMPLGSALDAAITGGNLPVGFAFEFVVINLGAATATMAVNTGVTFVGTLTVLTLTSVRWRVRKTAASTFIVYRVSN